jgi:signal transduction histidine kinase
MVVMMLTTSIILFLTSSAFFAYEVFTFRNSTVENLTTLGRIIAINSTAALAFDSPDDATEILAALRAEKHIIAACLFTADNSVFATYTTSTVLPKLPVVPEREGFEFEQQGIAGFLPVQQGNQKLGTLYILSDLTAIYERMILYAAIGLIFILMGLVVAYFLSRRLYKRITKPIFNLTVAARAISEQKDYSVRVHKHAEDELGILTDSFNLMVTEIESFNIQLEKKVEARTKELEIANKELESFSYSISHDLRAPLRTVNGFMQIFAEDYVGSLDEEAKRMMNKILISAKKMGNLIDDILEFSKLGRKELNKSTFSMNDLFQEVWWDQIRLESERDIELISDTMPEAFGDRTILKQVWVNLISNALKYSKYKEKTIIEIGSLVENMRSVYFIRDNGAGFNMEYHHKLFGVFQRLHSEKEFEGTGAGLAIVHRIISKHGGNIWATSEPNKGATFYFTIQQKPDSTL